jgi:UDP-perosamine 4-acetyltransferase
VDRDEIPASGASTSRRDGFTTLVAVGGSDVRVLVVGAGGHARVCVEALAGDPDVELVGAVSGDGGGAEGFQLKVLGLDGDLIDVAATVAATSVFVAIGDNAARSALMSRCDSAGLKSVTAVSPRAIVSPLAAVGNGSAVLPGGVVNAGAAVGRGVIVNSNATVDHDCVVGDFVHLSPGATVCGGVKIGTGTFVGAGATILPNVSVGARSVVAAGSVVVNDVPDGTMVSGSPARQHGRAGG